MAIKPHASFDIQEGNTHMQESWRRPRRGKEIDGAIVKEDCPCGIQAPHFVHSRPPPPAGPRHRFVNHIATPFAL